MRTSASVKALVTIRMSPPLGKMEHGCASVRLVPARLVTSSGNNSNPSTAVRPSVDAKHPAKLLDRSLVARKQFDVFRLYADRATLGIVANHAVRGDALAPHLPHGIDQSVRDGASDALAPDRLTDRETRTSSAAQGGKFAFDSSVLVERSRRFVVLLACGSDGEAFRPDPEMSALDTCPGDATEVAAKALPDR